MSLDLELNLLNGFTNQSHLLDHVQNNTQNNILKYNAQSYLNEHFYDYFLCVATSYIAFCVSTCTLFIFTEENSLFIFVALLFFIAIPKAVENTKLNNRQETRSYTSTVFVPQITILFLGVHMFCEIAILSWIFKELTPSIYLIRIFLTTFCLLSHVDQVSHIFKPLLSKLYEWTSMLLVFWFILQMTGLATSNYTKIGMIIYCVSYLYLFSNYTNKENTLTESCRTAESSNKNPNKNFNKFIEKIKERLIMFNVIGRLADLSD
jgi:hypothetical protein